MVIKISKFPWNLWIYQVFLVLKPNKMYLWYTLNIASCVSWYVSYHLNKRYRALLHTPSHNKIHSPNSQISMLLCNTIVPLGNITMRVIYPYWTCLTCSGVFIQPSNLIKQHITKTYIEIHFFFFFIQLDISLVFWVKSLDILWNNRKRYTMVQQEL